jgi:hypothetical protein
MEEACHRMAVGLQLPPISRLTGTWGNKAETLLVLKLLLIFDESGAVLSRSVPGRW